MKPNLTWTKADAKRAERMGWTLWETGCSGVICNATNKFSSNADAARWVVEAASWRGGLDPDLKTCQKAVLICCGGAR